MSNKGKSGTTTTVGTGANEHLNGGSGDDFLFGMAGDDRLNGGAGADLLDGGSGSDRVSGDAGDDTLVYVVGENVGASDVYDGGSGKDTLRLVMTREEWMRASVQKDVADFLAFLKSVVHPVNGEAKNTEFLFKSFGLNASKFEKLEVVVGGVAIDPTDQAVMLGADTATAGEDSPSVAVDVLANDSVPDLIKALTFTQAAHGTVTLVSQSSGAPGGSDTAKFVYTPDATHWQYLRAGETATDTFTYTVTDADGDVSTATVTVTIVGSNDAPVVSAITASTNEDAGLFTIDLLATASDVEMDDLDVASVGVSSSSGRTVLFTVNAETGAFQIDAGQFNDLSVGQTETVTVTYDVTDGQGGVVQNTATLVVEGRNEAPLITGGVTTGGVIEAEAVAGVNAPATPVVADTENNDAFASAQVVDRGALRVASNPNLGDAGVPSLTVTGTISSPADQDVYKVDLLAGEVLTLDIDFAVWNGSGGSFGLDSFVFVYDAAGNLLNLNDDASTAAGGAGSIGVQDSYLQFVPTTAGAYYVVVKDFDQFGQSSAGGYQLQISVDSQAAKLTDTGVLTFSDADLADGHTVSVAANGGGYLGQLTASIANAATGDGSGSVAWSFVVDNAAVQFLAEGQTLTQSYTVVVDDGNGGTASQVVDITLTGRNDVPTITTGDSTGSADEDGSTGGLIGFADVDLTDGHTVSATALEAPLGGTFTAEIVDASSGDGSGTVRWTYVPGPEAQALDAGESVLQRYVVTVSDGNGGTVQQLVNVTVTGSNDGPVAAADTATTAEDTSVLIDVLANDTDVDVEPLSIKDGSLVATNGVAVIQDGKILFTPNANYFGPATISYVVTDGELESVGSVAVDVTPVNDAPVANDDDLSPLEQVQLLVNGGFENGTTGWTVTDSGSGTFSVESDNSPPNGTFATPGPNQGANYVVTYQGGPGVHAIEQSFTVPVGATSVVLSYASFVQTFAGGLISPAGLTTSAGPNQHARIDLLSSGSAAFATGSEVLQNFYIGVDGTPTQAWTATTVDITTLAQPGGTYDLRFAQADNRGNFNLGVDAVSVVATVGGAKTTEDAAFSIAAATLLANDTDVDGDALTVTAVGATSARGGFVTLSGGVITYNPGSALQTLKAGEVVTDSFTYTVSDGNGGTSTATVSFKVKGVNDAPTVADDSAFANANGSVTIDVLANDSDPEGDALTVTGVGTAANGTVVINANGTVTYTPNAGFSGADSFTYTVQDVAGASAAATVSLVVGLSDHDQVGGDVFLQGNYMEIGVSSSGSLGTANAAPANYHPQGRANISYVVDTDGWTSGAAATAGDFTLPGSPVDTIVLGFNGQSYAQDERSGRRSIDTTTTDTSSGGVLSATTTGLAGGAVQLTQVITLDPGATYYTTTITVTNVSGSTVNDVRFLRSFDPDQDQYRYGNFTTQNDVLSNPTAGNALAVSRALGPNSGVSVNLVSFDADARASNYGFGNYNAYAPQAFASPVDLNGATVDQAITMSFSFGNLAAGQSATKVFYTSLNGSSQANDMLIGTNGADNLDAGAGNDILIGLTGNDTLTGGLGDDTFVFTRGSGADTILDFVAGSGTVDKIELRGLGFYDLDDVRAASTQIGDDLIINLGFGDQITLVGVRVADLSDSDFVFGDQITLIGVRVADLPGSDFASGGG